MLQIQECGRTRNQPIRHSFYGNENGNGNESEKNENINIHGKTMSETRNILYGSNPIGGKRKRIVLSE